MYWRQYNETPKTPASRPVFLIVAMVAKKIMGLWLEYEIFQWV
jgi:hypothetical protein